MNTQPPPPTHGSQALRSTLDLIKTVRTATALRERLASRWAAFGRGQLKELAIVGAADEGVRLAALCSKYGMAVRAIADDNPKKHGTTVGTASVIPVEAMRDIPRETPVIVASHRSLKPVRRIREMGFTQVAPFLLLQELDPDRFAPHMFHESILEDLADNLQRYEELAGLLEDDRSRAVLSAVINYRLEGEPESMASIVEWDLYGPGQLLQYGEDEVYVDGGTFDGDTIRLFIERVKGRYARVIGFEPDPATFARLKANFAGEPRVEPMNAGLHRTAGALRFDDAGTRGSVLVESGGISVPVVALDHVLKGDRVSYIKMNIEAAEIDALAGAAKSIERWKPKLAISAYHRPSHLWQVPAAIREIRDDYKLYFRQHDGGIIETVVYALPEA